MLFEQHNGIVPDSAGHLGLEAVAGADQRFSISSQDDCQNVTAILGDEGAGRSGAGCVVANQFTVKKRRSGCRALPGNDRNVDIILPVDVLQQKIPGASRKFGRNRLMLDHRIVPTISTRKYLPCRAISPVAIGEFFPYNGRMENIPASAREFERWLLEKDNEPWPFELRDAARRALLTMKSLDQPQAAQSPAFMEASRKDLLAFAMAYRAWAASKG